MKTEGVEFPARGTKPAFLKRRFRPGGAAPEVEALVSYHGLHTVCQSAHCPNQNECFGRGTATFLILGDVCTRRCRFCAIASERVPGAPDPEEPQRVARAAQALGLRYVVLTSVTRDDLALGGADVFAECIVQLRARCADVRVEVLTPDFQGDEEALRTVLDARPDVFNHNIETVSALYGAVRPQADYQRSLRVLRFAAQHYAPRILLKSGFMVGLGESEAEVLGLMDDLRGAGCEMLTIGQYLAPSASHHPVVEYVLPERFKRYRHEALKRGFRFVASGPFVRSSYHAEGMFSEAV